MFKVNNSDVLVFLLLTFHWNFPTVERNGKFCWGDFFIVWWKSEEECFWLFKPFSKLKTTFYKYWKLINPLCTNPTKWLNTLKRFIGCCLQFFLSVFDYFVGLAPKGLKPKSAWPVWTKSMKLKMVHEQWLQLKMKFLAGYNMKIII